MGLLWCANLCRHTCNSGTVCSTYVLWACMCLVIPCGVWLMYTRFGVSGVSCMRAVCVSKAVLFLLSYFSAQSSKPPPLFSLRDSSYPEYTMSNVVGAMSIGRWGCPMGQSVLGAHGACLVPCVVNPMFVHGLVLTVNYEPNDKAAWR